MKISVERRTSAITCSIAQAFPSVSIHQFGNDVELSLMDDGHAQVADIGSGWPRS